MRSFKRISGLDPISVNVPPRMAQNPMGMTSRDIGIPVLVDIRLTTGRNRAAAPMFCMKPEIAATTPDTMGMILFSVLPPTRRM